MATKTSDTHLDQIRHSASHIMAQAVKELYPEVKLGIGPATKEGFYYDFEREEAFTEEDLAKIEQGMREIVEAAHPFEYSEWTKKKALEHFTKCNEPYKCELIRDIPSEKVFIYQQGPFIDLCRGPHVANTSEVKAFKLLYVAGAYWKGSESNPMLQRLYGTAFRSQKELDTYLHHVEEAKKRDHRKLGKDLDLFSFHDEAPGMPFFHPKGMILYRQLMDYWREEHRKEEYLEVKTPIILREELWMRSGHYDHYRDHMYFTKMEGANFAVKPMNCPGANLIYKQSQRSYRDLPMRLAELGFVHRHELSGVMHGLFRVKAFTIDDAHIYCTEDQIKNEITKVIRLILKIYKTFQFRDVQIELSTKPEKAMGSQQIWDKAESSLKEALQENHIEFTINEGEGAFYGPKIDFHILDSLDRTWQCGTVQLDFSMPERFDLEYIGPDGAAHRPVMIHRAVFGSVERFLGILIEHFGGVFPLWLAPVQAKVLTISEKQEEYARTLYAQLQKAGLRADLDLRSEKISYKIRQAEQEKIPYMVVVGDKEVEKKQVALRAHGRRDLGVATIEDLVAKLRQDVKKRA